MKAINLSQAIVYPKSLFFLLLFFIVINFGCKENEQVEPVMLEAEEPTYSINYDGDNYAAPLFPEGTYEVGVKLTKPMMRPHIDEEIKEVNFYMAGTPLACQVKIYGVGTDSLPGELIYNAKIVEPIEAFAWHKHQLGESLLVSGEEIWVAIEITVSGEYQTIGCDIGPRRPHGDWVLNNETESWNTFQELTQGGASINWNIRTLVTK